MARPCPHCDSESLRALCVSGVDVATCPRCHGVWFDRGTLERFPGRPPVRGFLEAARQAPSRCRRRGHLVPPEQSSCPVCQGAPVACPGCGSRLARVLTSACPVEVCSRCEGVWLEAGAFERLEGVTTPQARPASLGAAPLPAKCSGCGAGLQIREAFAYEGDLYCSRCRPPSAVPRHPPPPPSGRGGR